MATKDDGAITTKQVGKKSSSAKIMAGEESVEEAVLTDPISEIERVEREKMAEEPVDRVAANAESEDKYLVKMERQNASWMTRNGVVFTAQHPFQLVDETEMDELLDEGGFRRADKREVVNFYKKTI